MLLPSNPYALSPSYACAAEGCPGALSATEGAQWLDVVRCEFATLSGVALSVAAHPEDVRHARLEPQSCTACSCVSLITMEPGHLLFAHQEWLLAKACRAVLKAGKIGQNSLSSRHHEWMAWIPAALAVASAADDTDLLLQACARKVGMVVQCRAGDDDVYVRVTLALAVGLDTPSAAEALRFAFEVESLSYGVDVEGFIWRWVPNDLDFELAAPEMVRILTEGEQSRQYCFYPPAGSEVRVTLMAPSEVLREGDYTGYAIWQAAGGLCEYCTAYLAELPEGPRVEVSLKHTACRMPHVALLIRSLLPHPLLSWVPGLGYAG